MNPAELLARLQKLGTQVSLVGDRLRIISFKEKLSDELWQELSAHKNELRHWLEELRKVARTYPALLPQPRPGLLPLSYAQQRLWCIDQLEGSSAEYNMPAALRLEGELDQAALERAINTIVERHESLRTHFAELDGQPVQVILPALRIAVPLEDLSVQEAA